MKIKSVQVKTVVVINGKKKTLRCEDWTEHFQEMSKEFRITKGKIIKDILNPE